MEILTNNFAEKLNFVLESVRTADFIALDTEFSGLNVNFEDQVHAFDQVEDRYQKLKHNCSRMNAFQIGICTFKWDPKQTCYVSRPFNFDVFPQSEILGTKTLQFKASNIRFLIKNHFDFNKLFTSGVNYQRLSDSQIVLDRIRAHYKQQTEQTYDVKAINFGQRRSYTKIGSRSNTQLSDYLRKVQNFVYMARQTEEMLLLEFNIESYALRRKLSQTLQTIYKDQNVIITSFQRKSPIFAVRKWRERESYEEIKAKEANGVIQKPEIKITEKDCELSALDCIIAGDRSGVTVYFEDEQCIAIKDINPVSPAHFLVIAKKTYHAGNEKENSNEDTGHLLIVASKVAKILNLSEGYRIVINKSENNKHNHISFANNYLHVIGGQQLTWPPLNEPNIPNQPVEESKQQQVLGQNLTLKDAIEHQYNNEMGFSVVMQEIINSKKPLVGHNCMYDWLYCYNQFIGQLPDTYTKFVDEWHEKFPNTFDNKVLAFNSKAFFKTGLGDLFDKVTNDDKYKKNLKFKFDVKNGCSNYDGTSMLSHYHEAAYDAHMTGVVFGHILKLKEFDNVKNGSNSKEDKKKGGKNNYGGNQTPEMKKKMDELKNCACDLAGQYPNSLINHMMLDAFGTGRVYHFNPEAHAIYKKQIAEKAEFPETVYLEFEKGFISEWSAETVSELFADYGDFYAQKATEDTIFLEFFYVDPQSVPEANLETFIEIVKAKKELKVISGCLHQAAPKFVAHDRFDYM